MSLFLLLCTGIREGWVCGVYRIQTFLDFYIFFIFTRPLSTMNGYMAVNKLRTRISCKFPVEASNSRRDPCRRHRVTGRVECQYHSTARPRRQRSQNVPGNCAHRVSTCMPTGCKFAELLARFSGIVNSLQIQFALI